MCKRGRITTALLLAVALGAAACSALAGTDASAQDRTERDDDQAEEGQADGDQDSDDWAALARPGSAQHRYAQPLAAQPTSSELGRDSARLLIFSSSDLWRHGGFAHGGALWAPSGLEQDGPVLKLLFGGGIYHYVSGALGNADVRGTEIAAAILPGWRFIHNGMSITGFAGYDYQRHRLRPDDPSAGLRGHYHGLRAGFEFWYQPSAMTMIAADASLSSVGPSYSLRLAGGLRVFDAFFVGPEIQAFGADGNYRQLRAGLHVTGFRTGNFEWSAGVGWATDSDDRSGAYGKLGVWTRR
jgi:hypothetical protein